jgi:spermidine/putrescine transport system ATP-binding protein
MSGSAIGTATAQAAVELAAVSKQFGDHVVVDRVALDIKNGEFFSLLGPSGCGKTTTLRMIAGFETPTEGRIRLAGEDVTDRPAHLRRVGMVFQNYALFPHLSVADNVAFALRLQRVAPPEIARRVAAALLMVRLPGLDARIPSQLSGGQQQRVALARALVFRPTVVLLDEPLGALDQKLRKAMQLELKTLQQEIGLTFVYVTHDQEEALTMSDRIAVMDGGRVLQVADPQTLYERPASRFVADFIGVSNFLPGTVRERTGALVTIALQLEGERLVRAAWRDGLVTGQAVTTAVRPERMRLVPLGAPTPPAGSDNAVEGTVRDIVYTGSDTQYFVELGTSTPVMVRVPNDHAPGARVVTARGDLVCVCWDAESTAVLVD